jgi:2-polyprenyl-6-methoxyphenol hydroxylase-like FAD-dependent oxidoreductase
MTTALQGRSVAAADHGEGQLPSSTPVVIAGGGPAGLATAVELAHHGIASVIIERRPEVSWLRPRAKTTSARTMEHFRRWGLADTLREAAPLPVAWSDEAVFCTGLMGREITRIDGCFGLDLAGSDLVAECGQQVPQPVVEHVLREAVRQSPLAYMVTGMEVVAAREGADGAEVDVTDHLGKQHRIQARYMIGCEGARSVVRDAIGAHYEGTEASRPNFNIVFRASGLGGRVPHGPAIHYWVLNPDQPGLVGRLDLDETWWCIAQGVDAETGKADPECLVHNLVGEEVPVEVLATDAWLARMLLVDRYSSRRLFLAGDAAHQNPPWGGHGFNTGIGDAVNLGWKMAAVLNGWAPDELLSSYEAERRPVAARTIDEAARNMATLAPELADRRLTGSDVEFTEARPNVDAAIHATKTGEFHSLELTLGYHYGESSIVVAEDSPEGETSSSKGGYVPTAAAGHRLPHHWVAPGDSLYDRLGTEFTLIGDLSRPAASGIVNAAQSLGVPLSQMDMPGEEWRDRFAADLVLVRPDQHVAWRGNDPDNPLAVVRRAVGYGLRPSPPNRQTSKGLRNG